MTDDGPRLGLRIGGVVLFAVLAAAALTAAIVIPKTSPTIPGS